VLVRYGGLVRSLRMGHYDKILDGTA
jgi:hypothetical protein